MQRRTLALLFAGVAGAGLVLSGPAWSYSDGIAGSSGQIEEHLRVCKGVQYCTVKPSYCGSCHGSYDDMWRQEGSNPTPQEHVGKLKFIMNQDPNAGTSRGTWEYTPGQSFTIEIQIPNDRPAGRYNQGGFDLNVSAGVLTKFSPGDENVRITGGIFRHAGSKNPEALDPAGQPWGTTESDERRYAGEATNTAKGAETRTWKLKWTAPRSTPPRGVALVMTAMLPDGNDGIDTCPYRGCNSSQGYEVQEKWDWFGFMIPRRILCERDAYASFKECSDAVYKFILPPAPPVNTCGPDNPKGCETQPHEDGGGGRSPGVAVLATLAALSIGVWTRRRRRA